LKPESELEKPKIESPPIIDRRKMCNRYLEKNPEKIKKSKFEGRIRWNSMASPTQDHTNFVTFFRELSPKVQSVSKIALNTVPGVFMKSKFRRASKDLHIEAFC